MNSMDNFRERFEALEQQTEQLKRQTHALEVHTRLVERRLRWWRGLAYGVMVLGLLSVALPSGKTVDAQAGGLPARVAALEDKLVAVTFNADTNELVITGANLHIINGLNATDTTNGLGNLIVGYNEPRQEFPACSGSTDPSCTDRRTGSHDVVVGRFHSFSSFGGLVVGDFNEISGRFSSVSGGSGGTASGNFSSVSGGAGGTASGNFSLVSGGSGSTASGNFSSVSGGRRNTASGERASVSGGQQNTASNLDSSISGGFRSIASGQISSVSGGVDNTASGDFSSVSGGSNRSAPGAGNWAAGGLFQTN